MSKLRRVIAISLGLLEVSHTARSHSLLVPWCDVSAAADRAGRCCPGGITDWIRCHEPPGGQPPGVVEALPPSATAMILPHREAFAAQA